MGGYPIDPHDMTHRNSADLIGRTASGDLIGYQKQDQDLIGQRNQGEMGYREGTDLIGYPNEGQEGINPKVAEIRDEDDESGARYHLGASEFFLALDSPPPGPDLPS